MPDLFSKQEIIPKEDSCYLISLDSKNKIRIFYTHYEFNEDKDVYEITRYSGQYKGKQTWGPVITVERGKVTRNKLEQTALQWNHLIKEKLDKGYKKIDVDPETLSEEELKEIVGDYSTNQDGLLKPMLAKQEKDIKNRKIFDKEWYSSVKINGVRCLIYKGKDNELHAASRGSITYDFVLQHILEHPKLIELFNEYPSIILDGEIYNHLTPLNEISGVCRSQKTAYDGDFLQFYWYDIVDVEKTFEERLSLMNIIKDKYNFQFNPTKEWSDNELKIQFVPQVKVSGFNNMMNLHNQYVEHGWEGLVIRDPGKTYKPGARDQRMVKIKVYKEDTFLVVGIEQGLRMYDDMCFVLQTKDGKEFKAKPLGTREQKIEYTDNFESKYLNHLGDCKYFNISAHGVVEQPVFIAFRWDLE